MRHTTPRHLTPRPPREQRSLLGQFLLVSVTIVIGGLLAMAVTRQGGSPGGEAAAPPEAASSQPANPPPPTATTPAVPETGVSSPVAPDTSGTRAVGGGGNLVRNPDFETDVSGWQPLGDAKLELATTGHESVQSASISKGSAPTPGLTTKLRAASEARRAYSATVWARATQASTQVALNLVERADGRRLAVDTAGVVLGGDGWQALEVTHVSHQQGSELALEIVAPDLPDQVLVLIDGVEVRRGPRTNTFQPATTR